MAKYDSLFSRCDATCFANLLEASFRNYYLTLHTDFISYNYLNEIKTIVGLGFTATLVDSDMTFSYQPYLDRFMSYSQNDFQSNPKILADLAFILVEMIHLTAISFHYMEYPGYYLHFLITIRKILSKIILAMPMKQQKQTSDILHLLQLKLHLF